MRFVISGSGTSHGIPVIGCSCPACTSTNPHDTRWRASAILQNDDITIVIDTGPEFRLQALKYKLKKLDAILVTHSHADHIHGLDDVRAFSKNTVFPVYSNRETLDEIRTKFQYVFKQTQEGGGKPHIDLIDASRFTAKSPLCIGNFHIVPVPMMHGEIQATGWRIGSVAYLTDLSFLPETSLPLLDGIQFLVIDGLRQRPHSTHFSFAQALDVAQRTTATQIYLTHLCHDFTHEQICSILQQESLSRPLLSGKIVLPAYDGLTIET